jgi:WD40 repeat protein
MTHLIVLAALGLLHFDQHGDPLPPGAIARFGTVRYRVGCGRDDDPAWALSPDGKTLAVETYKGVTLWDVDTGRPRLRLKVPDPHPSESQFPQSCFSTDGKHFVRVGREDVRVWDAVTGRERFVISLPGGWCPRFIPGTARFMVPAHKSPAITYDADTGRRVSTVDVEAAAWTPSPTGRFLLGQAGDTMVAMHAATGRVRTRFLGTEDGKTDARALSPDDRRYYELAHGRLYAYDVESGKMVDDVEVPDGPRGGAGLALSPDGSVVYVSGGFRPARMWSVRARKWLDPLPGDVGGRLVPLPDGKRALTLGPDGVVRRFDLRTRTEIPVPTGFAWSVTAVPSPDGRWVVSLSDDRLDGFDAAGRRLWTVPDSAVHSVHWGPDGKRVATVGADRIKVRDPESGRALVALTLGESENPYGATAVFPPGGDRLVVASGQGYRVDDYDLRTGRRRTINSPRTGRPFLTPDGGTLVLDDHRQYTFIDLATGKAGGATTAEVGTKSIRTSRPEPSFTPDWSYLVTWEDDAVAVLCDPASGSRIRTIPTGQHGTLWSFGFSPNSLWMAVGDEDGRLTLWDVPSATRLGTWAGHREHITGVTFAGAGRVLTTSADLTALLWDLNPRQAPAGRQWDALSGTDPVEAYRAGWCLAQDPTGPDLLRTKMGPVQPASPDQIGQWIVELGADRYPVREKATRALADLGRLAEPALKRARRQPAGEEVRTRLDDLITRLAPDRSPAELVQARAVAAMELAGTPAARKLLAEWAAGAPGARLTTDAMAALVRLGGR